MSEMIKEDNGVRKRFCAFCGCVSYMSSMGWDYDDHWRERGEYMYTVFKELKYNKTVTYRINEIDYGEYTTKNNYEKYNIIHLVHKTERDGNYISYITFQKGKDYGKYSGKLFPYNSKITPCPYCSVRMANGLIWDDFEDDVKTMLQKYLDKKYPLAQATPEYYLPAIQSDIQSQEKALPAYSFSHENLQSIVIDYLRHLANVEGSILSLEKNLAELYAKYWVQTIPFYDPYIMSTFPRVTDFCIDEPEEPQAPSFPFIFSGKRRAEYEKQVAAYQKEMQTFQKLRNQYEHKLKDFFQTYEKDTFNSRRASLLKMLDAGQFDELEEFCPKVEIEKARAIFDAIQKCRQQLADMVQLRAKLCGMHVIYPKYLDFPAVTTILEYLEVGRCTQLTGEFGAYNLYESELRSNIILSKLDQILASLDQIQKSQYKTYQMLCSISSDVQSLNALMNQMLDVMDHSQQSLDQLRSSAQATEYYQEETAYYARISAYQTSAITFLSLYDH